MQPVEYAHDRSADHRDERGWLAFVMVALVSVSLILPSAAYGFVADVRSHTTLVFEVLSLGQRPRIEARLVDNVHQGVAEQPITVVLGLDEKGQGPGMHHEPQTIELTTDGLGFARQELALEEGRYRAEARYEGSDYLQAASQVITFDVRRSRLTLEAKVPALVHLGALSELDVELQAVVPFLVGDGMDVEVQAGRGALVFEKTVRLTPIRARRTAVDDATLDRTEVHGTLSIPSRIGRGYQPVVVSFRGNDYFYAASHQREIFLFQRPEMRVSAEEIRERSQRGVAVTGSLDSADGPIYQATVLIEAKAPDRTYEVVGRMTTEVDGHFEGFVAAEKLPVGTVHLRYAFVPDAGQPLRSEVMTLTLEGGSATSWAMWLLLGIFGAILAVMLSFMAFSQLAGWLRVWRLRRRKPVRTPAVQLEAADAPRSASRSFDAISGVLWDAVQGRPLTAGRVCIVPAKAPFDAAPVAEAEVGPDGTFALEHLPPGRYWLWGTAYGFVSSHATIRLPHDGSLRFVRLKLLPVRERVREIYDWLLEQYAPDDLLWGWQTPREVEREVLGHVERLVGSLGEAGPTSALRRARLALAEPVPSMDHLLEATTRLLEEVYYSPRTFPEEVATLAQKLVEALREPLLHAAAAQRRAQERRAVGPLRQAGDL